MPRYFFQITEGEIFPDLDGVELADLAEARRMAVDIAAERLRGSGEEFLQAAHWRVEIIGESGAILSALSVTTESATADRVAAEESGPRSAESQNLRPKRSPCPDIDEPRSGRAP